MTLYWLIYLFFIISVIYKSIYSGPSIWFSSFNCIYYYFLNLAQFHQLPFYLTSLLKLLTILNTHHGNPRMIHYQTYAMFAGQRYTWLPQSIMWPDLTNPVGNFVGLVFRNCFFNIMNYRWSLSEL